MGTGGTLVTLLGRGLCSKALGVSGAVDVLALDLGGVAGCFLSHLSFNRTYAYMLFCVCVTQYAKQDERRRKQQLWSRAGL